MRKTINVGQVKQSLIDLTRIYKPEVSKVARFVKRFMLKYDIPRGYETQLEKIVLDELKLQGQ